MACNIDWFRSASNKIYAFLSGLSGNELFEAFCIIFIALTVLVLIPGLVEMFRCQRRRRKQKKSTQKKYEQAGISLKTVTPPTDNNNASPCPQKIITISSPVPRASSVKPDLDVEKLKKILNMN